MDLPKNIMWSSKCANYFDKETKQKAEESYELNGKTLSAPIFQVPLPSNVSRQLHAF